MSENEVKGTLNDVDSLNATQKQELSDLSNIATTDITKKKGKAFKTRVQLIENKDYNLELLAINKTVNRKPYPKAEDRLKGYGLSDKVNKVIISNLKNGNIKCGTLYDIRRLKNINKLIELDPSSQKQVLNRIIENRKDSDSMNSEIVSSFVIKNGYQDSLTVQTWYQGMMRLIEKLILHADIDKCSISAQLFEEQQEQLKSKTAELIKILERFV